MGTIAIIFVPIGVIAVVMMPMMMWRHAGSVLVVMTRCGAKHMLPRLLRGHVLHGHVRVMPEAARKRVC
jgi:hypothetical protein